MRDESGILEGWPAVPLFLMLAVTPVLTALDRIDTDRMASQSRVRGCHHPRGFGVEH